ncbi:UvrB/UvrC motif-containing protein [candidate division KSB1 bacterium]|nr:UvrB/UvrC motif-containing protein [candidate division KSB1 bacterium]RQW06374.1 MAG: hypothetical protein EH222_08825 [candidate division KSB1 bacterium]
MFDDISHILDGWKYSEHDVNVRLIQGADGQLKLQMRLDLGLLQMELDGRPDGRRPRNHDSYLDYFAAKAESRAQSKIKSPFVLSPMDCFKLQQEAVQYYHRYLALMKLRDYARVTRDTVRNLRVFDFVEKFADDDEMTWQFQQHRPYVIMMRTRAQASLKLDQNDFDAAILLIKKGIKEIESHNEKWDARLGPDSPELEFLHYWLDEISEQRPLSETEQLTKELDQAIADENYERAAELRDKIARRK